MAAASTQHGVTIAFGTTTFAGQLTILGANEQTRDPVETTHHGTTGGRSWIPEDLVNYGTLDVEFHFDPETSLLPISAAPETITITFVKTVPAGAPATLVGSGFFTAASSPNVEAGATETAKLSGTIAWDGVQAPAFTAETNA